MRTVEIYLTIEGLLGWRRMLVVREGQTRVVLTQPATLHTVVLRRSVFEALRPKVVETDLKFVRSRIGRALQFKKPPARWLVQSHRYKVHQMIGRYVLQNLIGPQRDMRGLMP